MPQKVLLFSDGPIVADPGCVVRAYELLTGQLHKVVTPHLLISPSGEAAPDCICTFSFSSIQDLYFSGYYFPGTGNVIPLPCIYMASHEKNDYPVGFEELQCDRIYTAESYDCYIGTVKIREVSTQSGTTYRVYFSKLPGCRWSDSENDGDIYYLDDSGNPVLYYHVKLDQIPARSCGKPGTSDSDYGVQYWKGDFAFKDPAPMSEHSTGTLLLSNGNLDGACIYQVTGAGLTNNSNFGKPQRLFNPYDASTITGTSGITGMQYVESTNAIYYASEFAICKVDLASGSTPTISSLITLPMIDQGQAPFVDVSYVDSWSQAGVKSAYIPEPRVHAYVRKSYYTQISPLPKKPTIPNPEPNERIIAAQKWVEQMVNKEVRKLGVKLTMSEWAFKVNKVGALDQISGTVRDQYGYSHAYNVRVAQDGRIQLAESAVI